VEAVATVDDDFAYLVVVLLLYAVLMWGVWEMAWYAVGM
jgi:hypothetical protein